MEMLTVSVRGPPFVATIESLRNSTAPIVSRRSRILDNLASKVSDVTKIFTERNSIDNPTNLVGLVLRIELF